MKNEWEQGKVGVTVPVADTCGGLERHCGSSVWIGGSEGGEEVGEKEMPRRFHY